MLCYPPLMNFHLTFVISIFCTLSFFFVIHAGSKWDLCSSCVGFPRCLDFTFRSLVNLSTEYQYTWQSGVIPSVQFCPSLQVPYTLFRLLWHAFFVLSQFSYHWGSNSSSFFLLSLIWLFSQGICLAIWFHFEPTSAALIITPLSFLPMHSFLQDLSLSKNKIK